MIFKMRRHVLDHPGRRRYGPERFGPGGLKTNLVPGNVPAMFPQQLAERVRRLRHNLPGKRRIFYLAGPDERGGYHRLFKAAQPRLLYTRARFSGFKDFLKSDRGAGSVCRFVDYSFTCLTTSMTLPSR